MFVAVTAATLVPLACSSGFPFPAGYVAGPVLGVPATCDGDAYLAVPVGDCPSSSCPGPVAFAVCDGTSFSGCTCTQPPGVLIPTEDASGQDSLFFDGGGGVFSDDSGGLCFGFDTGGSCGCSAGFDASCGAADGPLFDVGDQGDCSGLVAQRVPASDCATCPGAYAYLLCDGLFFTTCSCELPPGYEQEDTGAPSKDAAGPDTSNGRDSGKDATREATTDAAPRDAATTDAAKDGPPGG
jgi:hypothetical protein